MLRKGDVALKKVLGWSILAGMGVIFFGALGHLAGVIPVLFALGVSIAIGGLLLLALFLIN